MKITGCSSSDPGRHTAAAWSHSYSVQDNYFDGVDPTDGDQCFVYGLVDFTVQGWNGRDWVILADVINNDLCKRTLTFPPFTTDQIRISVTVTGGWSFTRIAEVEAWEAQ